MIQILSSNNLVSKATGAKAEKEKIYFKNLIEGFFTNVYHVNDNPKNHLNEVYPEKSEIYCIND